MNEKWLLLSNLLVAGYLTGLIWVIQVVHYPSFGKFSPESFGAFHSFHTERISLIVALPMLIELGLAGLLLFTSQHTVPFSLNIGLFSLVVVLWISTFFWAIPLHNRLEQGFDIKIIQELVAMNWIRTIAWTLRFGVLSWLIAKIL